MASPTPVPVPVLNEQERQQAIAELKELIALRDAFLDEVASYRSWDDWLTRYPSLKQRMPNVERIDQLFSVLGMPLD